jgi:hypothetical protein
MSKVHHYHVNFRGHPIAPQQAAEEQACAPRFFIRRNVGDYVGESSILGAKLMSGEKN